MGRTKLDNAPVILPTPDVRTTAAFYRDVLGFLVIEHLDSDEPFAAAYRDEVELVLVQMKSGEFLPNHVRYGAGYDLYLDPDTAEGVDEIYAEVVAAGARVIREPARVGYGSYEFVIEDVDGRWVGVGRVSDRSFFRGAFD